MPKDSSRRNDTRRANKDRRARLEELRRQQKAAERRKNFLFIGSAIVLALALIGAAIVPAYLHDRANKAKSQPLHQAAATKAEKAAGCLGVHNDPVPKDSDRSHVATAVDYAKTKFGDTRGGTPPIPPTGGHHNNNTLSDKTRFYPLAGKPRPERAVHNLEHGYVVIWYDSKLPADQVAHLQLLANQPNLGRLLVVGWWQGDLPADKHVVLTSWARTDRCSTVSDSVVSAFYKAHLNASIAPEATLTMAGDPNLPPDQLAAATPARTASPSPTSTKK